MNKANKHKTLGKVYSDAPPTVGSLIGSEHILSGIESCLCAISDLIKKKKVSCVNGEYVYIEKDDSKTLAKKCRKILNNVLKLANDECLSVTGFNLFDCYTPFLNKQHIKYARDYVKLYDFIGYFFCCSKEINVSTLFMCDCFFTTEIISGEDNECGYKISMSDPKKVKITNDFWLKVINKDYETHFNGLISVKVDDIYDQELNNAVWHCHSEARYLQKSYEVIFNRNKTPGYDSGTSSDIYSMDSYSSMSSSEDEYETTNKPKNLPRRGSLIQSKIPTLVGKLRSNNLNLDRQGIYSDKNSPSEGVNPLVVTVKPINYATVAKIETVTEKKEVKSSYASKDFVIKTAKIEKIDPDLPIKTQIEMVYKQIKSIFVSSGTNLEGVNKGFSKTTLMKIGTSMMNLIQHLDEFESDFDIDWSNEPQNKTLFALVGMSYVVIINEFIKNNKLKKYFDKVKDLFGTLRSMDSWDSAVKLGDNCISVATTYINQMNSKINKYSVAELVQVIDCIKISIGFNILASLMFRGKEENIVNQDVIGLREIKDLNTKSASVRLGVIKKIIESDINYSELLLKINTHYMFRGYYNLITSVLDLKDETKMHVSAAMTLVITRNYMCQIFGESNVSRSLHNVPKHRDNRSWGRNDDTYKTFSFASIRWPKLPKAENPPPQTIPSIVPSQKRVETTKKTPKVEQNRPKTTFRTQIRPIQSTLRSQQATQKVPEQNKSEIKETNLVVLKPKTKRVLECKKMTPKASNAENTVSNPADINKYSCLEIKDDSITENEVEDNQEIDVQQSSSVDNDKKTLKINEKKTKLRKHNEDMEYLDDIINGKKKNDKPKITWGDIIEIGDLEADKILFDKELIF